MITVALVDIQNLSVYSGTQNIGRAYANNLHSMLHLLRPLSYLARPRCAGKTAKTKQQITETNHKTMALPTTKCKSIRKCNNQLTKDLPSNTGKLRAPDKLLLLDAHPSSVQHLYSQTEASPTGQSM